MSRAPSTCLHRRSQPLRRAALLALLLAGCDGDKAPEKQSLPSLPMGPPILRHDFGVIPHGEAREHRFEIDVVKTLGPGFRPLNVSVDCACAKAQMALRDADGSLRQLPIARAEAMPEILSDQRLIVLVQLDTATKEPADFGPADSNATLVLQSLDAGANRQGERVFWPLRFRFAVDSPVTVRPFAVLDFESVALTQSRLLTLALRGDRKNPPVRFGPVKVFDPRLSVALVEQPDGALLRARFTAGSDTSGLGGFRKLVTVETDLESGYQVNLAAVGTVISTLQAEPLAKLSMTTDLRRAQADDDPALQAQYLVLVDHDHSHEADFQVVRLVDRQGRDCGASFRVRFDEVVGAPHSRRMSVRYLGGQTEEFRGTLTVATTPETGPFLDLELVALHKAVN
jgi:hypothetical protein